MIKNLKDIAKNVQQKTSDMSTLIQEQSSSVLEKVSTNFNRLKQLVTIETVESNIDTTYYFWVPDCHHVGEYILVTHRQLPYGDYDEKSLVKKRVFHVPSEASVHALREQVVAHHSKELFETSDFKDVTSDILNDLAEKIDEGNNKITKGLFVVGGIAALVNPVTGIAIIGASFMPNVVSDLIASTSKRFSLKLKDSSLESRKLSAENKATTLLASSKPEIVINSVLGKIDKSLKDNEYDPLLDFNDDDELRELSWGVIKNLFPVSERSNWWGKQVKYPVNLQKYIQVLNSSYNS